MEQSTDRSGDSLHCEIAWKDNLTETVFKQYVFNRMDGLQCSELMISLQAVCLLDLKMIMMIMSGISNNAMNLSYSELIMYDEFG